MKQQHQWRSLVFDLFLLAVAIGEVTQVVSWESPTDLALAMIAVGGLLLRRRLPWVSFLLAYPAFVWGTATIVLLIALFSLAARTERRWLITAASVLTFIGALRIYWGLPDLPYAGSLLAYAVLYAVGPVALGQLLRTREELSRRIAELSQARQHELERARADVLSTERARISREMHDVVSHQVSLIAVQAGALQVRAREGHTSDAARTIRGLAVRTLDELRQMVGVLRADGAGREPLDPQPRISDLPRLIEESGLKVQLRNELPALLTPALERAIYRTVQEGLTNARKHAPGAAVTISAKAHSDQVEVTVHSGQATATVLALPSSGTGLLGLRERALLLGGSLTATHTSDGFRLHFTAPLHVATTART